MSISVRESLNRAMMKSMSDDESVFVMGEEVARYQGAYKVTQGLMDIFGEKRVIDTPITEYGFAGLAIGAAFGGLRPIVEFMTFNFAMQAIDHIVNSAAKTCYMSGGTISCPIVFRGPNGAASRVAAQHSQNFAAWYAHVPGLKVIAPYTAQDSYSLLRAAILDNNPVICLENEILYGHSFDDIDETLVLDIGKANVIRVGRDVTIVAYSLQVAYALEAARILSESGIDAEVIDLRTIAPLDIETIVLSVQKTNRAVVVDECWFFGGVGASIGAIIMRDAFDYLDAPVEFVNSLDVPMPYAANLEKLVLPSIDKIVTAVQNVCYIKTT